MVSAKRNCEAAAAKPLTSAGQRVFKKNLGETTPHQGAARRRDFCDNRIAALASWREPSQRFHESLAVQQLPVRTRLARRLGSHRHYHKYSRVRGIPNQFSPICPSDMQETSRSRGDESGTQEYAST